MRPVTIARRLAQAVDGLTFGEPVTHVYNPLIYAREPHEAYLKKYAVGSKEAIFLGMNPGPFGMAQTGVPFGDVGMVRDWMKIHGKVGKPSLEHPKRPVEGFACSRGEVSGQRLWGWARDRFGTPEAFFDRFFVWNYCPLCFMEESGRNRTPDKLPASEKKPLFKACDEGLRRIVEALSPRFVVGVGKFAEDRSRAAFENDGVIIGRILHPSPASPAANRNWAGAAEKALQKLGIDV